MPKFNPFELEHPTFGACFIVSPRDAVFTGSGARAFRVQSAPKRLSRGGWRRTLLINSFSGDPKVIHQLHRQLYESCSDERRRGVR